MFLCRSANVLKCPACNDEDAGEGNYCIQCGARLPGDSFTAGSPLPTLSPAEVPHKLDPFRLADPSWYILKLVQAAVVSHADGFILESGSTELRATLAGVGFEAHSLEYLLDGLLQDPSDRPVLPALRHLAVAVHAALGNYASEIVIKSWNGTSGVQVCWTPQGHRSDVWQPDKPQLQTRFEMRRQSEGVISDVYQKLARRDVFGMMTGSRPGMDGEQALVYDHCAFCPIPIQLNGKTSPGYDLGAPADISVFDKPLSRLLGKVNPKHNLLELYLPAEEEPGLAPPRRTHTQCTINLDQCKTYSAILTLPARLTGPTQVVPVVHGVELKVEKLDWPGPPSIFYLDAQGLDVDQTGLALVHNEKALRRFSDLGQQLLEAARRYLTSSVAIGNGPLRDRLDQAIQDGRGQMARFADH